MRGKMDDPGDRLDMRDKEERGPWGIGGGACNLPGKSVGNRKLGS